MSTLKEQVVEYRKLEGRIAARQKEVADMQSHLRDLLRSIGEMVTAGERRLLRIGKSHVIVEHPMRVGANVEIEALQVA